MGVPCVATAWLVRDAVPSAPAAATAGSALVANRHERRDVAITDLALFRRLASETRPYRLHIAAIFVISMLAAPLTLLTRSRWRSRWTA